MSVVRAVVTNLGQANILHWAGSPLGIATDHWCIRWQLAMFNTILECLYEYDQLRDRESAIHNAPD